LVLAAPAGATTIKVTTTADAITNDGECSLREAITATNINQTVNGADDCKHLNGDTGPDVIKVPDDSYPVDGVAGDDNNVGGDFDVEAGKKLTILGDGVPTLEGNLDRVIHLESGNLVLDGIAITDGEAGAGRGGGILAEGNGKLTLDGGLVTDSSAARGGAIAIDDVGMSLRIEQESIQENTADGATVFDGGGGIYFDGKGAKIDRASVAGNSTLNGDGGGIDVDGQLGKLEISRTSLFANHADDHGGGGLAYDPLDAKATISHSLVSLNSARFGGGGLEVVNDPDMLVIKTTSISDNKLSSTLNEVVGGGGITNGGDDQARQQHRHRQHGDRVGPLGDSRWRWHSQRQWRRDDDQRDAHHREPRHRCAGRGHLHGAAARDHELHDQR
jgi:CSLREA domain-containing protein